MNAKRSAPTAAADATAASAADADASDGGCCSKRLRRAPEKAHWLTRLGALGRIDWEKSVVFVITTNSKEKLRWEVKNNRCVLIFVFFCTALFKGKTSGKECRYFRIPSGFLVGCCCFCREKCRISCESCEEYLINLDNYKHLLVYCFFLACQGWFEWVVERKAGSNIAILCGTWSGKVERAIIYIYILNI